MQLFITLLLLWQDIGFFGLSAEREVGRIFSAILVLSFGIGTEHNFYYETDTPHVCGLLEEEEEDGDALLRALPHRATNL